jgi:uncharacterized protein YndB with AHSA1/START domain
MIHPATTVEVTAGQPSVTFRRDFIAPVGMVFAAWTEPDQIRAWRGPVELPVVECHVDLRVGGRYRIVHRDRDGRQYAFHGVYEQIAAPRLLVSTFVYDAAPEHRAVETVTFEPISGGTRVTGTSVFNSYGARDFYVSTGMERGLNASHQRLDALLTRRPPTSSSDS